MQYLVYMIMSLIQLIKVSEKCNIKDGIVQLHWSPSQGKKWVICTSNGEPIFIMHELHWSSSPWYVNDLHQSTKTKTKQELSIQDSANAVLEMWEHSNFFIRDCNQLGTFYEWMNAPLGPTNIQIVDIATSKISPEDKSRKISGTAISVERKFAEVTPKHL